MNFYDFEVFMYDWLVVIINPIAQTETVIINDSEKLKKYYEEHKTEIWLGWNSRNYDTFILKSILLGFNPKNVNDYIIRDKIKGWQIDKRFKYIQLYDYDVSGGNMKSLKQMEAFMGNDIEETSVPFDIMRPLTESEINETVKYCRHDVEQTMEVFTICKNDFDAHLDLIKTFDLPISMITLTQAQLTANILGCSRNERFDEYDITLVDTIRIEKYKQVVDWFKDKKNMDYKKSLTIDVCGIPHSFGWGGLHGCVDKPVHRKGVLVHVDVTSYYPSIMIEYDFLTRNCKDKEKFKTIYDKRVELKKQGKKKEQAPYKIILNSTYGICKDKFSSAFDPLQANNVCVNGQLMLLDLLEHLEPYCEIIQSNTDGLIIQIDESQEAFDKIDDICFEWETRTRMKLGFDVITEIWQKDVNDYVFKFENGKVERKGGYVQELDDLNNDLPIVNKAIVNFILENIPVEKTINECNDLVQFQKVVRLSSKYKYAWYNGKKLNEKTFRVFADTGSLGIIGKQKEDNATIEKFANTPDNCFIDNSDIKNKPIPKNLNKKWYIDLSKKRLEDFGLIGSEQTSLF